MANNLGKKSTQNKKSSTAQDKFKSFLSLLGTLVIVLFIQSFFIQGYSTPTGSMLNTILIGDKMFFNQFLYGGSTPRNIPFTEIRLPYWQLPAIREPKRGDIINFEFPGNRDEVDASMKVQYLKRCVGEPGDTILIKETVLYVNGVKFPESPDQQFTYKAYLDTNKIKTQNFLSLLKSEEYLNQYEITDLMNVQLFFRDSVGLHAIVPLTFKNVAAFRNQPFIKKLVVNSETPSNQEPGIFPKDSRWNKDNFGPLRVPAKGDVINISKDNYIQWDTFIKREGHKIELRGEKVFIDGIETSQYTIENNYYFMMGDNRHNSLDSRFWGFVNRQAIVGKAWFTYFSWNSAIPFSDPVALLGSIRWDRIGMPIE